MTLCSAEIFDAHLSPDRSRIFFHSSSYTANPIACAAALASLSVWQTEPVLERIEALEGMHRKRLAPFLSDPRFINVRQTGTIAALNLNVSTPGYLSDVERSSKHFFGTKIFWFSPLGNVIYLMTPYCVTANDLDRTYEAIDEAADVIGKPAK